MTVSASTCLPERLLVGDLEFTLDRRPNRKTLEITVERDASLTIKVPNGIEVDAVVRFVEAKRHWVHRKLVERDALVGPPVAKQFVNGEGFRYLGRSFRLLLVDDPEVDVKLERGRFRLSRDRADLGDEVMRRWYVTTGGKWLRQRIERWANRMRTPDVEIRVLDLGYRWGSTRGSDRINIHWATLQLRPSLVDYVLVHELAHLSERNHTPRFWALVEQVMPEYEQLRAHLANDGLLVWTGKVW